LVLSDEEGEDPGVFKLRRERRECIVEASLKREDEFSRKGL